MKKIIILLGMAGTILFLAGCGTQTSVQPTSQTTTPTAPAATSTSEKPKTLGVVGAACSTYKDCQSGLLCVKSVCSNPPSYTKYFDKIQISKMKPNLPPGPNNMPVATTEFKNTDAIEIDFTIKSGVTGEYYYDLINSVTGETALSSAGNTSKITGKERGMTGTGFGIPSGTTGNFDLNIYFNNELIYSVPVTISQ